ncbi:hypothetical protein [Streptomyces sp. DSM 41534]
MDLTARHPRTGELLSTVKFMVQTLAAAGDLQRDLQRELTYDGLRAAEAKGDKGGRRPAVPAAKTDTAYLEGRSIAALARRARRARPGVTVRRGQGYTLRVSTARAIHRQLLARCRPLGGGQGTPTVPAQRKARREYEIRVNALQAATAGP